MTATAGPPSKLTRILNLPGVNVVLCAFLLSFRVESPLVYPSKRQQHWSLPSSQVTWLTSFTCVVNDTYQRTLLRRHSSSPLTTGESRPSGDCWVFRYRYNVAREMPSVWQMVAMSVCLPS